MLVVPFFGQVSPMLSDWRWLKLTWELPSTRTVMIYSITTREGLRSVRKSVGSIADGFSPAFCDWLVTCSLEMDV